MRAECGVLFALCIVPWVAPRGLRIPSIPDILHPSLDDEIAPNERQTEPSESDPEVRPGLFQGDMVISDKVYSYWRVGLRWDAFPDKLWPNATVPYVISPLYEPTEQIIIRKAISMINFMTCIKFVLWNGKSKDFLLIWPTKFPKGCWSYVGKYGGPQIVSLEPPDSKGPNCLENEGRAIHELLHALGIFHEQSRDDRDKYVNIQKDNIIPAFLANFDKQSLENTTYKFEYDYDSIMHYGKYFFSKGKGKPTITAKHPGVKLGQRKMLSKTDCLKLNELYGCLDKSIYLQTRYYTICNFLGL